MVENLAGNESFIAVMLNCESSALPYLFPRISRAVQRIPYLYQFFFVFPRRRRVRSTLSALRLSKLSRRDETRLSCWAQILPFSPFFLSRVTGSSVVLDKSCHRWRSYADSFIIPVLLFAYPRTVVSCPYSMLLPHIRPTSAFIFSISAVGSLS